MQYVQQILFLALSVTAIWLFAGKVKDIRRNILLGKKESLNDRPGERWRNPPATLAARLAWSRPQATT